MVSAAMAMSPRNLCGPGGSGCAGGNESTLVEPSFPRNSLFMPAMATSSPNKTETTPSTCSCSAAAARARHKKSSCPRHSSTPTSTSTSKLAIPALVAVIGFHDLGDQVVTHDVLGRKADDVDACNIFQDRNGVREPRLIGAHQIDLRGIARHHHARAFAQPGQHHLHLQNGRVL